jgi:hypothetical protein
MKLVYVIASLLILSFPVGVLIGLETGSLWIINLSLLAAAAGTLLFCYQIKNENENKN